MQNANVNTETGIRYGIVSVNSLIPDIWDDIYDLNSDTYTDALQDAIKRLRSEINSAIDDLAEIPDFIDEDLDDDADIDTLLEAAAKLGIDTYEYDPEHWEFEEENRSGKIDGIDVALTWIGGAPMLLIFESPYITHCRLCSPCVPNAGDLNSLDHENGYECYGVPADWYAQD